MTRYILIDNHSGYVWGEADAASPIAACRAVDSDVDPSVGKKYEEVGTFSNDLVSGYIVKEAPPSFPPVEDGQDAATIDAVDALPTVAFVRAERDSD